MMQLDRGRHYSRKGYKAAGEHLGIRKNPGKRDVALVVSECARGGRLLLHHQSGQRRAAAVTKQHVANGVAQAIICNSGNANTCNDNGIEIADGMCALVEQYTGVKAEDVVVASTGVIGQPMTLGAV